MSRRGFTVVELMVVVTVIGVVSSIAIPAYAGSRARTHEEACRKNRRALDQAKLLWMMDHGKTYRDDVFFRDLVPEYVGDVPVCPSHGQYALNGLTGETTCTVHGR